MLTGSLPYEKMTGEFEIYKKIEKEKKNKAKIQAKLAEKVATFAEGSTEKNHAVGYQTYKLDRLKELKLLRAEMGVARDRLRKDLKTCEDMLCVMDLQQSLILSDKDSAFFARGVLHVEVAKKYTAENNEDAI